MKLRQILNVGTVLLTLVVNYLANALPLNGRTTGGISDSFPVLFVPAGYVFSIWGVIYLGLLAFAAYQVLPARRGDPALERIGYWFVASNLLNSAWIFFWHYGLYPLTLAAMLGLLACLLVIYLRLDIGRRAVTTSESLLVHLPFSIYLGWISVATIANFTTVLYDLGWDGWGLQPAAWAIVMLVVATALGIAMIVLRREVAYPLVLIWAFAGIAVKQAAVASVAVTAQVSAGLLAVVLLASLVLRPRQIRPEPTGV